MGPFFPSSFRIPIGFRYFLASFFAHFFSHFFSRIFRDFCPIFGCVFLPKSSTHLHSPGFTVKYVNSNGVAVAVNTFSVWCACVSGSFKIGGVNNYNCFLAKKMKMIWGFVPIFFGKKFREKKLPENSNLLIIIKEIWKNDRKKVQKNWQKNGQNFKKKKWWKCAKKIAKKTQKKTIINCTPPQDGWVSRSKNSWVHGMDEECEWGCAITIAFLSFFGNFFRTFLSLFLKIWPFFCQFVCTFFRSFFQISFVILKDSDFFSLFLAHFFSEFFSWFFQSFLRFFPCFFSKKRS